MSNDSTPARSSSSVSVVIEAEGFFTLYRTILLASTILLFLFVFSVRFLNIRRQLLRARRFRRAQHIRRCLARAEMRRNGWLPNAAATPSPLPPATSTGCLNLKALFYSLTWYTPRREVFVDQTTRFVLIEFYCLTSFPKHLGSLANLL